MAEYSFDLHFHSCLSPCADDSMTPAFVAGLCAAGGIEIAALTDHNSCRNCRPFLEAARFYGILGVPGMELTTAEEVHVICLFSGLEASLDFSDEISKHLPKIKNKKEIFGSQLICDVEDNVLSEEEVLLAGATDISIYNVKKIVESFDGLCYPAHIDRHSNSLLSNLGMWDEDMGFSLIELSRHADPSDIAKNPGLEKMPYIVCSDAHYPDQIMDPHQIIDLYEFSADALIEKLSSLRLF